MIMVIMSYLFIGWLIYLLSCHYHCVNFGYVGFIHCLLLWPFLLLMFILICICMFFVVLVHT